jgi:glucan 1,3-beta-glucosidase
MIQVGNVGDVGNIEMQDLLFTSFGQLPGLILVSWWASAAVQ